MKVVYRNQSSENKRKQNRVKYAALIASAMLAAASVVFMLLIRSFSFLPSKYRIIVYVALGVINAVTLFVSILKTTSNKTKLINAAVCLLLSVAIFAGDIILPMYKGKVERLFADIPAEGKLNINVYVLADSGIEEISEMMGRTLGIQTAVDQEYQDYAINMVNRECTIKPVVPVEYEDVYSMAEALYRGDIDAMLLNETYVELLADNDDFDDISTRTKAIYTCEQFVDNKFVSDGVESIATEPFIVLVGGNDTYSYNLIKNTTSAGRTDVNIAAVVNPVTKQILTITIPRDSYVPLFGDENKMDKLTHATVYSLDCWKEAINELLDCRVNYFVRINFASFINIVDAVGGITVNNPYYFKTTFRDWTEEGKWDFLNYEFPEGQIYLNGHHALAYVRERKYIKDGEPIGDQGRNKHQAIAMKALIDKVTSVSVITHIGDLLKAVDGTFATDITTEEIYSLINMQLTDMAGWDFKQYNLTGKMISATSYAMGKGKGPIFDVTLLDEDRVNVARDLIDQMMAGEKISLD